MQPAHDVPERRRRWPLLLIILLAGGGSGLIWATAAGGPNPPPGVVLAGPTPSGRPAARGAAASAAPAPARAGTAVVVGSASRLTTSPQPSCPTSTQVATPPPATAPTPTAPTAGSVQQTISVSVRPGGPIRISPSSVTAQATGSVVTVGPVDVVDPRGTLAGWRVYATVVTPGWLVATSVAVPVSGLAGDLCQPTPTSTPEGVLVAAAPAGCGGGTFAVAVSLTGGAPGPVEVRFSVAGTGP